MNTGNEFSNIPIITLAGISSFTNLLSDLPLPSELDQTRQQSLLYNSWLSTESQKLLNSPNPGLLQELISVLRLTNTEHIETDESTNSNLQNGSTGGSMTTSGGNVPELLNMINMQDSNIFKTKTTFNSNPGYGFLPHNELCSSNSRTMDAGTYGSMQPGLNGPCLPYEHQQLSLPMSPYQNQDFEMFMNGINPALMQQMAAANQGAGGLLMGGAMIQGANQLMRQGGDVSHFPASVMGSQYTPQNMIGNFIGQSGGGDGVFKVAGTPPAGVVGVAKGVNKSFVDSSPAQASSAPPTGAEPIIRMGNNNCGGSNASTPAFDPVAMTTAISTNPPYFTTFQQQQLLQQKHLSTFPNSPSINHNQLQQQQSNFLQQQSQHLQQQQLVSLQQQQHLYERQHQNSIRDPFARDPCKAKVVLEPLDLEVHRNHSVKKSHMAESDMNNKTHNDLLPRVSLMRVDEKKDKIYGSTMRYDVVQDQSQNLKIKLSKRGTKRKISDDDDLSRESTDFSSSLSERVKRCRRSASSLAPHGDNRFAGGNEDDSGDASYEPSLLDVVRRKEEKKRKKHHHHHRSSMMSTSCDLDDDVNDGSTTSLCRKFNSLVNQVFEAAEEIDLSAFKDDEEETSCLTEAVISRQLLVELVSEAAKLKTVGSTNQVPYDRLVKLLTLLQCSIKQGLRSVLLTELDDDAGDDLFRELTLEHVTSGLDACLVAMTVMTSRDVPKQVFIEDVIEKVVRFTRNHLRNFIYPVFDPVYRVDPKGKGCQSGMKMKRSKASVNNTKDRTILSIYNKLTDITCLLAELVDVQELTDTIVLQLSSLSVSPFFVENIPEMQLNALKLVTNIFSKYEKHRQLILEDILSSLARLPSSKKNLRSYRLNVNENIQMVTALALQLIQCVVKLPSTNDGEEDADEETSVSGGFEDVVVKKSKRPNADKEVVILSSYETAMRTAHNFLVVFLGKCSAKEEDNYRTLFGNFVNDLLSTVNKPEWPAAELLLSILGHLLVKQFSCKSVEMSLRVASLDYLGIVAARLRKDAVSSQLNESSIDDIVARMSSKEDDLRQLSTLKKALKDDGDDQDDDDDDGCRGVNHQTEEAKNNSPKKVCEISKTEILQKGLLEYLAGNTESDPALTFARKFYVAQWLRDCSKEIETKTKKMSEEKREFKIRAKKSSKKQEGRSRNKKLKSRNSRHADSDTEGEMEEDTEEEEEDDEETKLARKVSDDLELLKTTQMEIEKRKKFLFKEADSFKTVTSSIKQSKSRLDYDSALLATRYLASNRPFSQSFDIYLTQILKVVHETAVQVRSRALKCLTAVVEADPGVLARKDMQIGVHHRFIDSSTSVREVAVELVGKFILVRPELTHQYYNMLSERILDTGISVRKRVIKIFRDICLEQPGFPKIPEMCVKMVRRVNDEEGIRKLVNETFQTMWFTPCRDKDSSALLQKVLNITDVVAAASTNIGYEWLEQLMDNLLKAEEESKEKPVLKACRQIVDCLVDNVLQLENDTDGKSPGSRLVSCFSTLYLFCKARPDLLVKHCTVIHPYLNIKFTSNSDSLIVSNAMKILELAVPLIEHPGESFLAQLEEDITKLVLKQGAMIIQSCLSCLGSLVRDVTHNYKLVHDCFDRFFGIAVKAKEHHSNSIVTVTGNLKACLRRSLYVVGLLCKHFDFDSEEFDAYRKTTCVKEKVFEMFLHFLDFPDEGVQLKSLTALGSLATRHFELMLGKETRDIYQRFLTDPQVQSSMCCQVLTNIKEYLIEEEVKMAKADAEWRKLHDKENLKEICDIQSGMASTIIQVYLKQILESFFHLDNQVRMTALEVISLVLNQGLVNPQQCMAHLICMGSDPTVNIRLKADERVQEIEKKYSGSVQAKAMQGIKMSCRLQRLLHHNHDNQQPFSQLRGVRVEENGTLTSLNSFVYSVVRGNRSNRRVLVIGALRMFEEKTPLEELLYMADNLAYFLYQLQDEPLFIIHHIDIILSVSGFNLLQSFRECFYPPPPPPPPPSNFVENGLLPPTIKVEDGENVKGEARLEILMTAGGHVKEESKSGVKEEDNEKSEGVREDESSSKSRFCTGVVRKYDEDDDDDDPESLLALVPVEGNTLVDLYMSLQGYLLLLVLKQHLKEMYGFTDNKIQQYSPMDFKNYEKAVNRKYGVKFNPIKVIDLLSRAEPLCQRNEEHRREIVSAYLNFKELMASIDRDDMDDNGVTATTNNNAQANNTSHTVNNNTTISSSSNGPAMSNRKQPSNPAKSRKRQNTGGSGRSSSHHGTPSSSKKNKKKVGKKNKRIYSDSEEEEDDDDEDDADDADWE